MVLWASLNSRFLFDVIDDEELSRAEIAVRYGMNFANYVSRTRQARKTSVLSPFVYRRYPHIYE
jgi:hypothetical protein